MPKIAHTYNQHVLTIYHTHPVHINDSGMCVQGMWNAQNKDQMTEIHSLKVHSNCDTALSISVCDITMA